MIYSLKQFSMNDTLISYFIEENETDKNIWFCGDSIMELFEIGKRVPAWELIPNKWLSLVSFRDDSSYRQTYMSCDAVYALCNSDYVDLDSTPVYPIAEAWGESDQHYLAVVSLLNAMNEAYENFPEKAFQIKLID